MAYINPENLLHLAALASGLSIAYVGLDKIHPADRKLDSEIDAASKNWSILVQELELKGELLDSNRNLSELYNINAMHLLCYIARRANKNISFRAREAWRPVVLWTLRQYHFPLMPYFRHKLDLGIITFFAFGSTLSLLLLSSNGLFPYELFTSAPQLRWLFWFYAANIIWVFISAACSAKLFSIKKTCSRFEEKVRLRVQRFNVSSIHDVTEILAKAATRIK